MVRFCRSLMIALVLLVTGRNAMAAGSGEHDFKVAANAFTLGAWEDAARAFKQFVQDFPESPHVPEAILYQGEAAFCLGHYWDTIELLKAHRDAAGRWADLYLYWIAEAQFGNHNYSGAADAFGQLIKEHPDSGKLLEAIVGEAAALAREQNWNRVAELLGDPSGAFQNASKTNSNSELLAEGWMLLGESRLALKQLSGGESAISALSNRTLNPELTWRKDYLQTRLWRAQGRLNEALDGTTNLLAMASASAQVRIQAQASGPPTALWQRYSAVRPADFLAESVALRASILEQTKQYADAIAEYRKNASTNAPTARQREALLKITDLQLQQGDTSNAVQTLQGYLEKFPNAPAADMALLALGELRLKQYAAAGKGSPATAGNTNLLSTALTRFDSLLNSFSNSPLRGKAFLNKGWCLWEDAKLKLAKGTSDDAAAKEAAAQFTASAGAFQSAVEHLPVSEDQAVARFKWGDAQFELNEFSAAITNYQAVARDYQSLPEVKDHLVELALYQTVRSAVEATNLTAASEALTEILQSYPDGFAGDRCLLLLGQGEAESGDTARARKLFSDFIKLFPKSDLLPQTRLAIARTYERDRDWSTAIAQYADWIGTFTNHSELPNAEFSRAWDTSMAGQETNALPLFTGFVNRFPTNALAPQAQWWVADYYFRQGDFQNAEANYQLLYQKWPSSQLTYRAQMMAGRAAVARLSYKDAIGYFTNLTSDPNCPPDLYSQALFAYGDAEINLDTGETNRPANLNTAINIFKQIPSTNTLGILAMGRIGDCYLQLAATDPQQYTAASNAYHQVVSSQSASETERNQAKVALGVVAEGIAQQKSGDEKLALLKEARSNYLAVFTSLLNDLREGKPASAYWLKESGLKAARIDETLQDWTAAINIYKDMETALPPLRTVFDKKILSVTRAQNETAGAP